jgi:cytochrome c-type biogenesis protein CcmE
MKPRTRFLIGGLLVLGSAGYLMASSIRDTGMYYLLPAEYSARLQADSSFRNTGVKIGARVVKGSIQRDPSGKRHEFLVTDESDTLTVVYLGLAPDTFTDEVDVVLEGRLAADGRTFQATTLLAKCASRYENAPEKYRDAPGYRAAQSGA